jgi:PKHD-type hydroxylase
MLLQIPDVLPADQVDALRHQLLKAEWIDGRLTAGHQSVRAKSNLQLAEGSRLAREAGDLIVGALQRNPLFISAALPLRILPPMFNCYREGQTFGSHVDNAIRQVPGTGHRIRTDLSATLFLTPPDDYEGGELVVEDTYGAHAAKLPAGHLVLYPATSLHHVRPVTAGARISSFFWIQSMVRDDGARSLLFDLDTAIQRVSQDLPDHPGAVQLTGVYHNLVRRWAEL